MAIAPAELRLYSNGVKPPDPGTTTDPRCGKYLTFRLAREEFAIQVLRVREIMGMQDITAVPQTPHYMKGVINLRGKIVPVIDLRLKFGFPEVETTPTTCIIVAQLKSGKDTLLMGLRVDAVCEVLNFAASDIEDTPDFGRGVSLPYLLGIAKVKGAVKILLNIDEVLSTTEVQDLEAVL